MSKKALRYLGAASVFALLVGGDAANAATTIILTGTVPVMCSLVTNTLAGASGIALQTTAAALAVGSVDETCNDDAGYSVAMVTTNGVTTGMFKTGSGDAQHRLAYTVKYATVAAPFVATSATVTDVVAAVGGTGTVNKAVTIGYTAATPALSQATDYTDILTFTMTAK
jgi:hypothetical protein